MKKICSSLLIVAIAVSMTGCSLFRSDDEGPTGEPVPQSGIKPDDPTLVVDLNNDNDGWKDGASDIAGQPGDFIPIPNQHFPSVYFSYNRDVIGTAEQNKLNSIAKLMTDRPEICLIIEGNCDERGSVEYNRALGERRAIAVKDYFLNKGLSEDRFKTISYGEERPAVEGTDATARAKNRRADLIPAKRR
ncbi:MAG: OmpA family protein [Victivallaceae bacterium]|nr:OmpA family protein [Victivallaceae bacterium]